ncbi:MAG: ABC transporter permease [Holosporaceae bacterium]|jgi:ABC-2 type transport system permease protein|nr:ABC transporter permease [Holosporaceae bacterium]
MTVSFTKICAILKKEFLQLKRDRATAAMVVLIPIVQLLLFGYAIDNDPRHLHTALLSRDNGVFSRTIAAGLKNSEYFRVDEEVASDDGGRKLLQQGVVQFVLTIPEDFSRNLVRGRGPSLLLEADASDPVTVAGAVGALNGILTTSLRRCLNGPLSFLGKSAVSPLNIMVHKLYNPEGFTRYNIIPGLIGVLLLLTGMMITALSLTRERERGTMENMLSMPVTPIEVMCGKIVPYILIGYLQAAVIILVAYFLFDIPILGSSWLLALTLLMFLMCNLALGFAISTAAKNQMQSIQMTIFLFLPSIMLSGFMFPFSGMPQWAQAIGNCIPMTYFIRIARGIILKGSNFSEIWRNFWPLLLLMLTTTAAAVRLYRKTLD